MSFFRTGYITAFFIYMLFNLTACGGASSSQTSNVGKGGSMARFSFVGDYLYAISGSQLKLFDLSQSPATPSEFANVEVSRTIETLYSANNHLFIGASDGVYIFDNNDPASPFQIAKFLHVAACDPVVVSGNYAYVTLRGGANRCRRNISQLDVIDLSDINNPTLVKSTPMLEPKGLGVENGNLFVCDGSAGLKGFDLADPANPVFVRADRSLNCYDLIPDNNHLIVSDAEGIVQLDYTIVDLDNNRVSHIQLEQE